LGDETQRSIGKAGVDPQLFGRDGIVVLGGGAIREGTSGIGGSVAGRRGRDVDAVGVDVGLRDVIEVGFLSDSTALALEIPAIEDILMAYGRDLGGFVVISRPVFGRIAFGGENGGLSREKVSVTAFPRSGRRIVKKTDGVIGGKGKRLGVVATTDQKDSKEGRGTAKSGLFHKDIMANLRNGEKRKRAERARRRQKRLPARTHEVILLQRLILVRNAL